MHVYNFVIVCLCFFFIFSVLLHFVFLRVCLRVCHCMYHFAGLFVRVLLRVCNCVVFMCLCLYVFVYLSMFMRFIVYVSSYVFAIKYSCLRLYGFACVCVLMSCIVFVIFYVFFCLSYYFFRFCTRLCVYSN